ncbi:hypothetical protein PHAVU_005G023000 [Phaseolus vulgaris]|uniref:Uncharacterized protein n=1 Tax=Phaseolus vulgaris TaxID=3885 RepID=V7BSA1_PHAVU|nr:hypothetical protein PHAVU_005G023000g [Phaseolus vulgaris]ESW20882.1 hypothetical protein PHAVU_005G023000g [Phaseolus vulgaris]
MILTLVITAARGRKQWQWGGLEKRLRACGSFDWWSLGQHNLNGGVIEPNNNNEDRRKRSPVNNEFTRKGYVFIDKKNTKCMG